MKAHRIVAALLLLISMSSVYTLIAGTPRYRVAALVKSWNPEFIITLGDNNYPSGEASTTPTPTRQSTQPPPGAARLKRLPAEGKSIARRRRNGSLAPNNRPQQSQRANQRWEPQAGKLRFTLQSEPLGADFCVKSCLFLHETR